MTEKGKVRKAFEVAKELNIATPTILDFLASKGSDVSRKQMQPVDEDMYVELLKKFDKARLQKYTLDISGAKGDEQKLDSVRLREAEIEALKAVGDVPITQPVIEPTPVLASVTSPAPTRKIELPKPTSLKVVTQPVKPPVVVKPEPVKQVPPPEIEVEPTPTPVVVVAPVVEVPPVPVVVVPPPPVIPEPAPEPAPDFRTGSQKAPVTGPRKIELPQARSLKIIQQAPPPPPPPPPKPAQQPRQQQQQQHPQAQQQQQTAAPRQGSSQRPGQQPAKPNAVAIPLAMVGGGASTGQKKKLKRKKLVIQAESPEELIEKTVDQKIQREGTKPPLKAKTTTRSAEPGGSSSSRHKRKKKGKGDGAPAPAGSAPAGRGGPRKPRVVDQQEVTASIRKTMAMMDGGPRKRHHHAKGAGGAGMEEVVATDLLRVTEFLTTQELANMMDIPVQDVIRRCLEMGMIISINQRLDRDTVILLAAEFEYEVEFVADEEIEEEQEELKPENMISRQPIVTVMGHVDHGKTTLLDYLRRTRVAEKEFGGITQHIGAYEVILNGQRITFLDTPGHEAFTAMRARGAQLTDLVILVVAADDRVMPQTLEAIDHARAAAVPIVVAVNKVDKANADPEAIYKQLADANVLVEKWGGKYQSAEISAKFGQGVDELLQEVLVASELLDLKSDATTRARGVVIESRLDRGLGVVATVLVQSGTLRIGDPLVAGQNFGKVRTLYDEANLPWTEAGPARPVQVIGFSGVPQAGDKFLVYANEKEARDVSLRRQQQQREVAMRQIRSLSLEQMSKRLKEKLLQELPLIIKGDVHGSVEVLADALMKLSTGEVKVNIIHRGVGAVTESDVLLGAASGAIVIGFHVHPNPQARELARNEDVEIRSYRLIHEVVDDIHNAMEGMLAPTIEEKVIGQVEIRKVYKISRLGSIAGCHVLDGKITRHNKVRLLRDGVEIWKGELASLKRFKDDAREVVAGFECGLNLNGYNDIQVNDRIEVIEIIEKSRKLEET